VKEPVVFLAAVFLLGWAAQWLAWRLRLPAILLLLIFGFAAGWYFDGPENYIGQELLFPVVSLAVAVILFEGGLNLRFAELKGNGRTVLLLVTVGIAVTWALTTVAAWLLLRFEPSMAALLGAILVVSGPTVIMPLLRHVRPNRRIGSIVKWEGIINDPIGAVLAVVILYAITTGGFTFATPRTLVTLTVFLAVGATIGLTMALLSVQVLKRYWVPDYLQNPAFLTVVVLSYIVSNSVRPESGLVAVTVFGAVLANQKVTTIKHVVQFKENLRVLLISCLFIVLAARLQVQAVCDLGLGGVLFGASLILVVRPAAVFLATLGQSLGIRERVFLAWIHPRGIVAAAVSSVFALELARKSDQAGLPLEVMANAEQLVPITFLVIVGTVAVYGLTIGPLARWMRIAEANPQGILFAGASPLVREIARLVQESGYQVLVVDTNQENVAAARMAGLPTVWANVCSEYAREELELGGIGRLLAMTPNDEVNALAARELAEVFGRAQVYQLPHRPAEIESLDRLSPQRAGRILFALNAGHGRITERLAAGAVVKKTGLTEEFDYAAFLDLYGESAIVMFVIDESGRLIVRTTESTGDPQPGQTLISIVDPV